MRSHDIPEASEGFYEQPTLDLIEDLRVFLRGDFQPPIDLIAALERRGVPAHALSVEILRGKA